CLDHRRLGGRELALRFPHGGRRRVATAAGLTHPIGGDELLGEERLDALKKVLGIGELGLELGHRRLDSRALRFPARDLGLRRYGYGLPSRQLGLGGGEARLPRLDGPAGDRSPRRRSRWPAPGLPPLSWSGPARRGRAPDALRTAAHRRRR